MNKWLWALFLFLSISVALAQGADVGLVNMISGAVTFAPLSGASGRLQSFMKVREGDRINVPAGGQVRVVFFDGARQELWTGPASFRARKTGAEALSGKAVEVITLPASAPQRLARVPELMQHAKLGGIQVRGGLTRAQKASLDQQSNISEARIAYNEMRRTMAADDVTPELFMFAALHEYLLYDEMKTIADEMLRKQPENEQVQTLAAWVRGRVAK